MKHIYLPLSEIQISEDRQRQYFDEQRMAELIAEIAENDLIHAIAVREDNTLVSGERRVKALAVLHSRNIPIFYGGAQIPHGTIPAVVVREKSDDAYYGMELSENIGRADLTWQERAEAIARYHAWRKKANPEQSFRETARELSSSSATPAYSTPISESVVLAKHLDDPEVQRARSAKDALRIVERKAREQKLAQLAKSVVASPGDRHMIIQGDSVVELPRFSAETFDCIITDPPYGIDTHRFGSQSPLSHTYTDTVDEWLRLMVVLSAESFRIAKKQAHLYVFCDIRRWEDSAVLFEAAGWEVWPKPLIWNKSPVGIIPRPVHGPRYCYETILYGLKGQRPVVYTATDVISMPPRAVERHAAEKPPELYVELLRRSCNPGDTVIDPFAGCGPVIPAANLLSLNAVAIERDEVMKNYIVDRLREGYLK